MAFTKSGAYIMVKIILFFLFYAVTSVSQAAFLAGLSTNSWQEKIPVVVQSVEQEAMTSFSSYGLNLGVDFLFSTRIRYGIMLSYLSGKADLHKLDNAVSPRRNFYSSWLTNKIHWRVTKTFSFGPSLVLNYRKIDDLDAAFSAGGFLDFDFDLFDQVRLTQSLGTMSDSKQLAYALTLVRRF